MSLAAPSSWPSSISKSISAIRAGTNLLSAATASSSDILAVSRSPLARKMSARNARASASLGAAAMTSSI